MLFVFWVASANGSIGAFRQRYKIMGKMRCVELKNFGQRRQVTYKIRALGYAVQHIFLKWFLFLTFKGINFVARTRRG